MDFKQLVITVGIFAAVVFAVAYPRSVNKAPTCPEQYKDELNMSAGRGTIKAQLALSSQEQDKGLGGRKCIGPDQGMLFMFDKPGYYSFWMKNMKFSIDMIWLDESETVVAIQSNVSPSTYPKSFASSAPAQYVLEIQAGRAASLDLKNGSKVQF